MRPALPVGLQGARRGALRERVGDGDLAERRPSDGTVGASWSVITASGRRGFGVELGEPGGVGSRPEGPRGWGRVQKAEGGRRPGGGGPWGPEER